MTQDLDCARFQSGAELVAAKALLDSNRKKIPSWTDFLIIDDNEADAAVLRAVLHSWLGHESDIAIARSLGTALDRLNNGRPDVIFLDHMLPPQNNAAEIIPYLRGMAFDGPIVVISGALPPRSLQRRLLDAGAAELLHKDDMNSMGVANVLLSIAGVDLEE